MVLEFAKKPMVKKEICKKLGICEGTLSVQLSKLCSAGRVKSEIDPKNYKRKLYYTEKPNINMGQVPLGVFSRG